MPVSAKGRELRANSARRVSQCRTGACNYPRAQERADHQTSLKSAEPNTSPRQAPQFNAKSPIDVLGAAQCTISRRAFVTRSVARDLHGLS
jgi:hypothetical protein